MMRRIAVYDNHTKLAETMRPLLAGEELELQIVRAKQELLELLREGNVRLVLMDSRFVGQECGSNLELISDVRRTSVVPIVVVSEQDAVSYKVMALNSGADDYVPADCNPLELLARIKSQLRRYTQLTGRDNVPECVYRVNGLVINDVRKLVTVDGREAKLTPTEYKILRLLVQKQGKVLPISRIYEAIWHMQPVGADNTIAVHVRHIREKIEENPRNPKYLKVVWGTGYKVG